MVCMMDAMRNLIEYALSKEDDVKTPGSELNSQKSLKEEPNSTNQQKLEEELDKDDISNQPEDKSVINEQSAKPEQGGGKKENSSEKSEIKDVDKKDIAAEKK